MKLVHRDLGRQIAFDNYKSCEWIIESPKLFSKYLQELYRQSEGEEGNFILSDEDKEISIDKYVEVIVNPFCVNINDKKILNKLYTQLAELAYAEDMYLLTQEIQSKLKDYVFQLEHMGSYILEMDSEVDATAIFKVLGVRIDNYSENFFENINLYIKVITELLKKKVIVFINLKSFLEKDQIKQLTETAIHNEVRLLFLENHQRDFSADFTRYIIDKDGCEI